MPRGDQVARFYKLVMALSRAKYGLPAVELARRNDWTPRTVYRDLRALEVAGFPISRVEGARWKLVDGWQERVPFPLPIGQLLGLHVARNLMSPLRGTRAARDFTALFERLTGDKVSDPSEQGELFRRFRGILASRSQLAIDYRQHEALLETLCSACESQTTVRIVYYAEFRKELTRRRIDPYTLYYDPHLEALYVFAWCHLRQAMRTFAVHRFRQVTLTRDRFEIPSGFTVEEYLRGSFRIWRGENASRVRLAVARDAAGWVGERTWHASQKKRRRPDGGLDLEFVVDGTQEVKRFILGLGSAVEVLEPTWLREEVRREHESAAAQVRAPRVSPSLVDTRSAEAGSE